MGGVASAVSSAVDTIVKVTVSAVEMIPKIVVGVANNTYHVLHGALTGNFTEWRDGVYGNVQTAIAGLAIFAGIITGNPYFVVAGVTMLDAQYNDSKMLRTTVHGLGQMETALFGSKYIAEYEDYIVLTATIVAQIVASYGAYTVIEPMLAGTKIAQVLAEYGDYIRIVNSGFTIYSTYQQVQNIKEYYENLINSLLAEYERIARVAAQRNELWFNLFTDPDMIGRIMPGGDLYNGGAGSPYFTVTDAHEPSYLMLASETKRISDIDGIYNGQNDSLMAGGRDYMYSLGAGIKYN
ncbi:MAG TPA: hypothetical protein PKW30_04805 [Campylobacterales bacterium]|nr:hypothetical protein [Campylobacterales bacterium]